MEPSHQFGGKSSHPASALAYHALRAAGSTSFRIPLHTRYTSMAVQSDRSSRGQSRALQGRLIPNYAGMQISGEVRLPIFEARDP